MRSRCSSSLACAGPPRRACTCRSGPRSGSLPLRLMVLAYRYGSSTDGDWGRPARSAAWLSVSSDMRACRSRPASRRDAIRVVAVEDLVEVRGDDAFLALLARERLGQLGGLDDLLGLALVESAPGVEQVLGQRRARTSCWVMVEAPPRSAASVRSARVANDGGLEVEALVLPERSGPRPRSWRRAPAWGSARTGRRCASRSGTWPGDGSRRGRRPWWAGRTGAYSNSLTSGRSLVEGRDEARRGAAHGDASRCR